jgi:hypothetical protein
VAAELQCKALGLWLCDDEVPDDQARKVRRKPYPLNYLLSDNYPVVGRYNCATNGNDTKYKYIGGNCLIGQGKKIA